MPHIGFEVLGEMIRMPTGVSGRQLKRSAPDGHGGPKAPAAWARRARFAPRRLLGLLAAATLLAPSLVGGELVNRIVAKVDGEPITLHELNQYRERNIRARQAMQGASDAVVLESLITEKIIEKEVQETGVIVRDEDIDRYIEGIKERNRITDEQLAEALEKQGLTLAEYRTQVREELQRQQLINREIRGKVNVTPEEVERYYNAHLDDYALAGSLQIAHIVFLLGEEPSPQEVARATAQAQEVMQRIRDGADFAEMARTSSQDASATSGGTLGWFSEGELYDSLDRIVVRLEVGEVAGPVRSPIGVHILKLLDRRNASHRGIDEVGEEIKDKLYAEALEERFQQWLTEDLRKRHHVEVEP